MFRMLVAIALVGALPACNRPAGETPDVQGPVKGVDRRQAGKPAPATPFRDAAGKEISLASFRGRPLLVNLWATWCAPCVKELPTLDRAALAAGPGGLQVIAISQDKGPQASVAAFLQTNGIRSLAPYHDQQMAMSGALGAEVLPTTVLFDAEGRELWRFVGDLDWTGAEALKLLGEAEAR